MGTVASITIISPNLPIEQRHASFLYLHRKILWGSPVEYEVQQALTAREYQQLLPDGCQSDADIDHMPRDPQQLKAVFAKIYDYLRLHSHLLPHQHWLNAYEDDIARWSDMVSITDDTGIQWNIDGSSSLDSAHRDSVRVISRANNEVGYWLPVKPDITVANKIIRVRTETWFEYCRSDIEAVLYACTLATRLNLRVSWTFG